MGKITISIFTLFLMSSFALAEPVSSSEREIKRVSEPMIKSVMEAYNDDNYAKMAVRFKEIMFKDFPQSKFDEMRKAVFPLYGKLKAVTFMGAITQLGDTVVIYKGEAQKSQLVIKLVITRENGTVGITGLWFE